MGESGSPERRAPRETNCGRIGSAEPLRSRRRRCRHRRSGPNDDRAARGHTERHAKKEWTAKAPNHPRVASALPHSEGIAYTPPRGEVACAHVWGGWGRLSDDGPRQHNLDQSEGPWGGGLPHLHGGGARSSGRPDTARAYQTATRFAKGRHKPHISPRVRGAALGGWSAGRCCPTCRPSSRV
jgi:hypothetical protein